MIDGKKVEAKAAVPRNSGSGNSLTKKMFVGGTVRLSLTVLNVHTVAILAQQPHGCPLCANTLTHCERLSQGDIADEEFSQYFSQFGDIEDCVVSLCTATTCAPLRPSSSCVVTWCMTLVIILDDKHGFDGALTQYFPLRMTFHAMTHARSAPIVCNMHGDGSDALQHRLGATANSLCLPDRLVLCAKLEINMCAAADSQKARWGLQRFWLCHLQG